MTTIQHQRIIGVVLLFSVIIGIAMILIRSADDGVAIDNTEQISSLGFESDSAEITKPYVSEARINLEGSTQHLDEFMLAPTVIEPITLPAAPALSPVPAPKVAPIAAVAPAPKAAPKAVVAPTPKAAPTSTDAQMIKGDTAEMWIIQLASFSVKANADALNLQAKQMGYKSVIENSVSSSGKIYRVRLEPIADKQKAQTIASELNKNLKLTAQVFQE